MMRKLFKSVIRYLKEIFGHEGYSVGVLNVQFDERSLLYIMDIKQRCELKSESDVIIHALAAYDCLTLAVTAGKTIVLVDDEGEREVFELFPM